MDTATADTATADTDTRGTETGDAERERRAGRCSGAGNADAGRGDPVLWIRRRLDDLAEEVARATDADDRTTAWAIVRVVEAVVEVVDPPTELPAAPVLARRFAAAHRRLLQRAPACPGLLIAALPDPGPGAPGR